MTSYLRKPSSLFYVISSVALVWNLMGVFNYLGQVLMTDDVLKSLPMGRDFNTSSVIST